MISLGLLGFDTASVKSMSTAILSRAASLCQNSEPDNADVILVDIDKLQDPNQWRKFRQPRNIVLIAISQDPELPASYRNDFTTLIKKPLRFTSMISTICEAANIDQDEMNQIAKPVEVAEVIDEGYKRRSSAMVREHELIDPESHLLGMVLNSVQQDHHPGQHLLIMLSEGKRWSDGQWLVINKRADMVLLSISPKVVSHTAIMDFTDHKYTEEWINEQQYEDLEEQSVWHLSIEKFIWILTRDTIRSGQLKTYDLNNRYRLKHWPNLTSYSTGNSDIAISSYWIENSSSANELAEKLNIPLEEIASFAACCFTAGLLIEDAETKPSSAVAQNKGFKKILSMILNKLDYS